MTFQEPSPRPRSGPLHLRHDPAGTSFQHNQTTMRLTLTIAMAALMGSIYLLSKSQSSTGLLNQAAEKRTTAIEEAQAMWP